MQVIERIAEHYDVQEMPFGRDYKWSPEQVVLKCSKCGKRKIYNRSQIIGSEVSSFQVLDEEYEAAATHKRACKDLEQLAKKEGHQLKSRERPTMGLCLEERGYWRLA